MIIQAEAEENKHVTKDKFRVSLVALNPGGTHNTSLYLLKSYATEDRDVNEKVDFKLHFFDSLIPPQSNGIDLIVRKIADDGSDLIGFSCYCWNIKEIIEAAGIIKLIFPEKKILLGGPEASGNAARLMERYHNIDMIIKGEGEIAFQQLMKYYIGKIKSLEEVNNLVYRNVEKICKNDETKVENLGCIPSLFSSGLVDVNQLGESLNSFETKRGCKYQCDYCFHHKGSHQIREYPIEQVKAELKMLLSSGLKYIWIIDPCFNENEERSIEIIRFIVENNHKGIFFGFELRNETLTERFIIELSRLRTIRFIAIGLQTLTDNALGAINRMFDSQSFEQNLGLIKKYFHPDIRIHIDLIYGLPLDTLEGYKRSIDYALSLGGIAFTQPLKILPGTRLEVTAPKYGMAINPNPPYEVLYHDTFSFEDMYKAKKINTALYLYQSHPVIKQWFEQIHTHKKRNLSEIFEEFGSYLWNQEIDPLFQNYKQFSAGFLLGLVREQLQNLYHINIALPEDFDVQQIIQVDWGSIANQQFYR